MYAIRTRCCVPWSACRSAAVCGVDTAVSDATASGWSPASAHATAAAPVVADQVEAFAPERGRDGEDVRARAR